jgi:hypothetical protein
MEITRKTRNIKNELLIKSKEAMLAAIQVYNNPTTYFKSENFIILSMISWTYLMHAYFKKSNIDYRYYTVKNKNKSFNKTKHGAVKFWELEKCIDFEQSPLDQGTKNNLKFLIGLRHEIEHKMTDQIDGFISPKIQACCFNYNNYIKKLFGSKHSVENHLSFSLQFASYSEDQVSQIKKYKTVPSNITKYISAFEKNFDDTVYNDSSYSYHVIFIPKTTNNKSRADKVIEFIPADSPLAEGLNREYAIVNHVEKKKYLPKEIVEKIKSLGYIKFRITEHTSYWKEMNAKDPKKKFGTKIATTWYWYDTWYKEVENYCKANSLRFK